jgi:hypothetical protein
MLIVSIFVLDVESESQQEEPEMSRKELLASIKMPQSHKTTAQHIDNVSHARKQIKEREHDLRQSCHSDVANAYKSISQKDASLYNAPSLRHVDAAFKKQRASSAILRRFENSNKRQKARHNKDLRTKRAWDVAAAQERHYVKQVGRGRC